MLCISVFAHSLSEFFLKYIWDAILSFTKSTISIWLFVWSSFFSNFYGVHSCFCHQFTDLLSAQIPCYQLHQKILSINPVAMPRLEAEKQAY